MYAYVYMTPYSCIYIFTDTEDLTVLLVEASLIEYDGVRTTKVSTGLWFPSVPQGVQPPAPHTFILWVLDPWLRHCSKNSWAVLL